MSEQELQNSKYLEKAVVENAKWVNSLFVAAVTFAGIIVILKITGAPDFEWFDIKLSINWAWIIFLLLSIAHSYSGWLLVKSTHSLWLDGSRKERLDTFHLLSSSGGLIFRGLIPRVKYTRFRFAEGVYLYQMRVDDPTTWLAYGAGILIVIAIIPYKIIDIRTFILLLVYGIVIVVWNWIIASRWLIALSELTLAKDRSLFHTSLEDPTKKVFGITRRMDGPIAPRATLNVMEGDEPLGRKIEIYRDTSIGRSRQIAEIVLQQDNKQSPLSSLHCTIIDEEDCFLIRDEDSANGTFLNGVRLSALEEKSLQSGDIIELGIAAKGGVKLQIQLFQDDS